MPDQLVEATFKSKDLSGGMYSIEEEEKEESPDKAIRDKNARRDRQLIGGNDLDRIRSFTGKSANVSAPMALNFKGGA